MEFCEQQQIYLVDKYPQVSTYVHENDFKKSQIDYILSDQQLRSHIESIDILTNQSTHTSDHNPTLATLNIDMDKKKQDCL
jgi:endonuclease/exonuclease/phosphatase family metal-dependent hydrolase